MFRIVAITMLTSVLVLGLLATGAGAEAGAPDLWGNLDPGPHAVGFRLTHTVDGSRTHATEGGFERGRAVRVYVWYPMEETDEKPLRVSDYARMAADDFGLIREGTSPGAGEIPLPVPLARGLEEERVAELLNTRASAVLNAPPLPGPFPLIIVGQGLYYESPLSQVVLCEHLASHGYVVAMCPLVGNHSRLANRDVVDLEAEIRDMEFVLSRTRELPFSDDTRLGVIGFDQGGMAGLVLVMRNPEVDAFVSLDAGILYEHPMGIPQGHPQYDENLFRIPWLHMTQTKVVVGRGSGDATSLLDRKPYGDSYLVLLETTSHGDFTSYADFGVTRAVPGYWGPVTHDAGPVSRAVNTYCRTFLDAYVKDHEWAHAILEKDPSDLGLAGAVSNIERRAGKPRPPYPDELVQQIIEQGMQAARPSIEAARVAHPDEALFEEDILNWLGYHFLYWWGRESEAVKVFELVVDVFPESANAYDSLGEAYAFTGDRERAIASYRRSLELNPENSNAVRALEGLEDSN